MLNRVDKFFLESSKKTRITISVAALGILLFLGIATLFPFKDQLFNRLFPKPPSQAEEEKEDKSPQFISNELLIKVKKAAKSKIKEGKPEDTGIASLNGLSKKYAVKKFEKVGKTGKKSDPEADIFSWYKITLGDEGKLVKENGKDPFETNIKVAATSYKADPNIDAAELNYIVTTQAIPNDPYYSSSGSWSQAYQDLWGMHKINAEGAWDQTTGSASIIVADIDTGVDRNHEDIKDNVWVNTNETPNNGIDDDGNGYVDDYYGWDWANNDNDPMDDHGHGTHTVGTIAAVGNNGIGVVGVNWTSKIMALKFLNSGGSGSLENGAKALQYAAEMGARVSSNSWGCSCQSSLNDDAIKYEHDKGMVTVVAAGNNNGDAIDFSPASVDYAITVAASDSNDAKASFSNWGEKIDVAAPGVDILSTKGATLCDSRGTVVGTYYCRLSGTSMATPHVAGLAALLLSKNPSLTNEEVRQIIRTGADDLGTVGKDKDYGYGRINATGSISLAGSHILAPLITSPRSRTIVFGTNLQITGSIAGPNFVSYKIEVGSGRAPTTWVTVANSTTQVVSGVLATVDTTKLPEGPDIFRLSATDTTSKTYQFQVHDVEVDNFDTTITNPGLGGLVSQGTIDVVGSAQAKNGLVFANYKLEWGEGASPASWSTSGITIASGGTQPVSNGLLGTWDTSTLVDSQTYTLRLTVNATSGATSEYLSTVKVDRDLVKGWPKSIDTTDWSGYTYATPAIGDLDGDGSKEVVILAPAGKVLAFRKDGSMLPGFPAIIDTGFYFEFPPNVVDLDNDGKKEIISAATPGSFCQRKIYITRSDGTSYPGWPNPTFDSCGDITPSVADLNQDGKKELVFIEVSSISGLKLHASMINGIELPGFPKKFTSNVTPAIVGPVSIADLDSDRTVEIAFGIRNEFYLFDNNGNILPGWPSIVPDIDGKQIQFRSAPGSGDVDGDGIKEIFALGLLGSCGGCDALLYGWKKDGTLLPNFGPKREGVLFYGSGNTNTPSFVDIDNDGKDEIAVGVYSLKVYAGDGTLKVSGWVDAAVAPSISDVDGDGKLEFASVYSINVRVFDDNGDYYWSRQFPSPGGRALFFNPAVLSDIDTNGRMELAVAQSISSPNTAMLVYLWELPGSNANPSDGWPMFGHDPQRTSRLTFVALPPTPTSTPTPSSIPTSTPTPTPSPSPTSPPIQNYGAITGTVYSSAGGTVPGAKITTKVGNANKAYYSNTFGIYSIPNLPPGNYSLTFSAKGYVNQKVSVPVTANTTTTKDVTMIKR